MSLASPVAIGWLVWVLYAFASPAPALAASSIRIDLFDAKGNRTGLAVVEGGRIDLFDTRGNRTGSAWIEAGRPVDFFDPRGNRTGYAVIEGDRIDFFDARSHRVGFARVRDGDAATFDRRGVRTGTARRPPGRARKTG
jgi:hypothetical protein